MTETKAKKTTGKSTSGGGTTRLSRPQMLCPPCPKSKGHQNRKIYKTEGRSRYCKCNDCGHNWQVTGPYADPLREYALELAKSFDDANVTEVEGEQVVLVTKDLAATISKELRGLISGVDTTA